MKILAGLIRLFEASSASDRAICYAYTHNGQLQLKANDLGHCAVYEKELQRLWPINEEIGRQGSRSLQRNTDFGWHIPSRGHCAIFLEDYTGHDIRTRENRRDSHSNRTQGDQPF
jgi:hypothetical protein